jgi:hypothetical protein
MILTHEELYFLKKVLTDYVEDNSEKSHKMIGDKAAKLDIIDETLDGLKVGKSMLSRVNNKLGETQ